MPYRVNADLPLPVRHALPPHAQDIYRAAFNHAWERYGGRPGGPGPGGEERCHRIAWAAVKRTYHKTKKGWVENR